MKAILALSFFLAPLAVWAALPPAATKPNVILNENWWASLEPAQQQTVRYVLGGAENPMVLSSHDWLMPGVEQAAWHQNQIKNGALINGAWAVDVKQAGAYAITLYRWPRAAEPVHAGTAHGDAGSDLYAYYTALDYTIPLSEMRMNVPFANEEQVQAWRKAAENPTPREAPQPENPVMKVGTACPNFGGMFKGSLEAVGIYNRKLDSDDVSRLAAGEVVKEALVAHYPFNQNMADSRGGKPAMPHGDAGFSSGRREGSQALQLDGRSMWVQLPVETPPDGFTWSAWIKTSGPGAILSHCSQTGVWHALGRCLFIKNRRLSFDVGWVGSVDSSAVIADGQWHHVAVAGGTGMGEVVLYVDGKRSQDYPSITGKYADLVVHIDKDRSLVFGRETSYLPWLQTPRGRFPFKQLVECKPDPMCLSSYVRIIRNEPDEVLIHWCHVPDPASIVTSEKIHELISVKPEGKVVREIKVGTPRLDDFQDPANATRQVLQLTATGIEEQSLSKARLSGTPGRAVVGSAVMREVPGCPAAWLRFDEGLHPRAESEKYTTRDSVSGAVCTLSGHTALWKPGVSGTALGFDGYSSKVTFPRDKAPRITGELTLEAWVVLDAYPWNDAGIVHQSAGEAITPQAYKHGYYDPYIYRPWEMQGYMLGIDPYGRPMFKVNGRQVGSGEVQHKDKVDGTQVMPTYQWIHLAGVYGNGSLSLYMNGKRIDRQAASGAVEVPDRDLLIGLNGDAQRCSDPVSHSRFAADNNPPIVYGIEGLIDEVRIHDRALSDEQIRQSYEAFRPPAEVSLGPRILPGAVTGKPAGAFGASYATLAYHELWDNLWRPSPYRDIVVRFDGLPTTVVFWQGVNFGSGWVTENNRWMVDQSVETGGPYGCSEHMSDKRSRFGHVRLIENTDARVVVHWRYPQIDVGYVFTSPSSWVDEYYTIYPDGAGVREVSTTGYHDTQFLTQAGTTCLDNIDLTALTVANLDGKSADLTWVMPDRHPPLTLKDACIKVVNFKSSWKVFVIYPEGVEIETWGQGEQSKHTPDPFAGPWNHWPVGLYPSDGRYAVAHDRVTSAALGGASEKLGRFILYGFTDQAATSLIPLAKSWNRPPTLGKAIGCENSGYIQAERAYRLAAKTSSMSFTLEGSKDRPIHNPCFAIHKWTGQDKCRLEVNGKALATGTSFRQGITRDTDGTRMLMVWVNLQSTSPAEFTVKGDSAARPF